MNEMILEFDSKSENEGLARMAVAAFITSLDPTLEELADVKTAVSEAVTNSIIHGYGEQEGKICLHAILDNRLLKVEIEDKGVGIEDIEKAKEPLYTTRPEWERSGMGFTFMAAFMDSLEIESSPNEGTCVRMTKQIGQAVPEGEN